MHGVALTLSFFYSRFVVYSHRNCFLWSLRTEKTVAFIVWSSELKLRFYHSSNRFVAYSWLKEWFLDWTQISFYKKLSKLCIRRKLYQANVFVLVYHVTNHQQFAFRHFGTTVIDFLLSIHMDENSWWLSTTSNWVVSKVYFVHIFLKKKTNWICKLV